MKIKSGAVGNGACACGSWLKHWEKFSGQSTLFCPVKGCLNRDLAGAHVQMAGGYDHNWYIYPLCKTHNKSTEDLEVSANFALVPADPRLTCGRPSL